MPQLYDMVNRYKPDYIWSDGDWEASADYWDSKQFIAWLYNDSPVKDTILVNDRWGKNCSCHHGDVKTCGIDDFDPGHHLKFKWEDAMTLDRHSWGYRRDANLSDFHSIDDLIALLVRTISCGGNLVMNFGPTADGRIMPIFEERLRQVGSWLQVNGEAIYKTRPWRVQNDTLSRSTWYTSRHDVVFAILLSWPQDGIVRLRHPVASMATRAQMQGIERDLPLEFTPQEAGVAISLRDITFTEVPCQWAWVLKLMSVT